MSFTSLQFLFFLPVVFALYWTLQRHLRWQNLLLVVASYVFYGWWDARFLLLIALTTGASYLSGLLIEHFEGDGRRRLVAAPCAHRRADLRETPRRSQRSPL